MKKKIYFLVDCNSFYASCERVFRPDLHNRPVIVLSNNDGCVVALSKEAKKLDIKRGVPLFKIRDIVKYNDVAVFSSNYELYGDISNRIMNLLKKFSPDIEVYSIDEAFLDMTGFNKNKLLEYAKEIKEYIYRCTKIPVSIGIGESKTLAKLANREGKKRKSGIFNIIDHPEKNDIFKKTGVHDIWGVGFQYAKKLHENDIYTIEDFVKKSDDWVKKKMTSTGLFTLWELQGRACIEFETKAPDKKQILSSRSFGSPVTTLKQMKESIAFHIDLAAKKLRNQKCLAGAMLIFIGTNRFKDNSPQYSNSIGMRFDISTAYTPDLIRYAHMLIEKIFKSGYEYKRSGIMLAELTPSVDRQLGLFENSNIVDKKIKLSNVIDSIQKTNGNVIKTFAFPRHSNWSMKRNMKSPNYTTSWLDIPIARAI